MYKATVTYIENNNLSKIQAADKSLTVLLDMIKAWDDITTIEIHIIKEKGE